MGILDRRISGAHRRLEPDFLSGGGLPPSAPAWPSSSSASPLAQLFRQDPRAVRLPSRWRYPCEHNPSSTPSPTPQPQEEPSPKGQASHNPITTREALKTPAFWLISGTHAMGTMVVISVMVHMIPHTVQRVGISVEAAAILVTVMALTTPVGTLIGGIHR